VRRVRVSWLSGRSTRFTIARVAWFAASAILTSLALAQDVADKTVKDAGVSADSAQIRIPNRPSKPLFQSEQGRQRTEIYFDPNTKIVTVKLLVQDPQGYFIPNIRRENFGSYVPGAVPAAGRTLAKKRMMEQTRSRHAPGRQPTLTARSSRSLAALRPGNRRRESRCSRPLRQSAGRARGSVAGSTRKADGGSAWTRYAR
jgi:hypothetical protein